jgi:hypothetical protein
VFHRINKAQPAIWRDPSTIQIGLDKNNVVIEELTFAQQQIIAALYSGVVDGQQEVLDETYKTALGTTNQLITKLSSVMEGPETVSNAFGNWQQIAFAELARAALDYEVNPEMVLAERWHRVVHIDQLDKSGMLIAKGLLASGVGKVVTHDESKILNTDLGELGFSKELLGQSRFVAVDSELQKLSLTQSASQKLINLNYKPSKDLKVSFAVTSGHLATRPITYIRWLNRDVPHINITFDLYEAQISPIVIPGSTPCLNCLAESKVDEDPAWPAIASQLIDLPRTRDDSSSLLSSAGLVLRSILRHLDESAGFKVATDEKNEYRDGYRIEYATGNVHRARYEFHKLCKCSGLDEI